MAEYIEREKARELIKNYGKGMVDDGMTTLDPVDDIVILARGVDLIPAADVGEVRHGEWVFGELGVFGATVKCSNCGWSHDNVDPVLWDDYPTHKFCGACGAKMDGKGDTNVEVD